MIIALRCIGIDVSKDTLDVFDDGSDAAVRIGNTPEAIAAQIALWRDQDVFVVFEATGVYDRGLATALHEAGVRCARVNPVRARAFARAAGYLAKTDRIDARMLAAFARAMAPAGDMPRAPEREALALLAKRRDQLVCMRAQEKNRAGEAGDRQMAAAIGRHIDFLSAEIAMVEADIATLMHSAPAIAEEVRILRSAPGVGKVACMQMIALMPELGRIGPAQAAALAGLAPMNHDSGRHRGKRFIGGGRKRVRDALYMAALTAVRRSERFKTFYDRLRSAGKAAKLALVAVARKLLVTLNAMLRDRKAYRADAAMA